MKYIILGEDNKEYGPVDGETLRKWVESGRVLPETQVRNSMIKKWGKARDLDFLAPAFATQSQKIEKQKTPSEKGLEMLGNLFSKKESKKPFIDGTSFRHRYLPESPGLVLRLASTASDWALILIFFVIIVAVESPQSFSKASPSGDSAVSDAGTAAEPGSAPADPAAPGGEQPASEEVQTQVPPPAGFFSGMLPLFATAIIFYYAIGLGLYAQTFGMWFWGLIIVRSDLGEVLLGRAYAYSVLMILLSVTTPLFVFLNPSKRSLPEYLSDTMIIRIAARPKA